MNTIQRFRESLIFIKIEDLRAFSWKSAVMLLVPCLPAAFFVAVWYYGFHLTGFNFEYEIFSLENLGAVALVGLFFSIYYTEQYKAAGVKYDKMERAAEKRNVKKFMRLRDKHIAALTYIQLLVPMSMTLIAFMLIHQENVLAGVWVIWSLAYLFGLMIFSLYEYDNPLTGIWVLEVDPAFYQQACREWEEQKKAISVGVVSKERTQAA